MQYKLKKYISLLIYIFINKKCMRRQKQHASKYVLYLRIYAKQVSTYSNKKHITVLYAKIGKKKTFLSQKPTNNNAC